MNVDRARFLESEFNRAMVQYPVSHAQTQAAAVAEAIERGEIGEVNRAIAAFMSSTEEGSSYDHELAYALALDGRLDPTFTAQDVPETVLPTTRRDEFVRAVRQGQMDVAAAILRIDQFGKIRAILRKYSATINGGE